MFEQFDPIPIKGKMGEKEKSITNLGFYFSVLGQLQAGMTPWEFLSHYFDIKTIQGLQ